MKNFISDEFYIEHLPQWFCPSCSIGILELDKKSLNVQTTAKSLALKEHPEYDHEWEQYSIAAQLNCNNKKCSETVMALGGGRVELDQYYLDSGEAHSQYDTMFTPSYFQPSLNIFNVPKYVPDNLVTMLKKSFGLFFCDSDSCGNRIRACIEFLLDELKIPRVHKNKQEKEVRSTLHYRIENLPENHEKIKGLLLAIKWLGNVGSHGNDGLTKKDVIDAYKILQLTFDILYKPSDDLIFDLANKINEAKGIV
jgi:hypothetical protein